MRNNFKQRKQEGFTIIEVLIVLAIAGLIMLVVFLAVPALQRNSRNTQAKNEAANIGGAVAEFVSNNNGKAPSSTADAARIITDSNTKTVTSLVVDANTATTAPTETTARIQVQAKCKAATGADVAAVREAGSSVRQLALLFLTEKAGGTQVSCTDI